MTQEQQRPISVIGPLSIFFTEQVKGPDRAKLRDSLLHAFSHFGAEVKEGQIKIWGDFEISPAKVTEIVNAGARFSGALGKWLNDTPNRMAKYAATADAGQTNSGGFKYGGPTRP